MIPAEQVCEGPKNFAFSNGGSAISIKPSPFGRHLLSKQELALAVGVSVRTLDNWVAQKRIPFLRLSARMLRFNLDRVLAALTKGYEVIEVGGQRK